MRHPIIRGATLGLILAFIGSPVAKADDWPRFRGPNGSGVAETGGLPSEFGPDTNVQWKVGSGRGVSSPIVAAGRLIFSSFDGDQRTIHCLDSATGLQHWNNSYEKVRDEVATAPCDPATPTPVADERNVYVFFPDAGLICLGHDGHQRWRQDFEPFQAFHGIASSLVVADGKVIVLVDQLKGSFMAAYHCDSGELAWKVDRISGTVGGYSTPATYETPDGATSIVTSGPYELAAYAAGDGQRQWWLTGVTNAPISLPVVGRDRVYVCEPYYEGNPFKIEDLAPYDKDKDGRVALDEVGDEIILRRMVANIDERWGNGDGAVDGDEMQQAFGSYVNSGGLVSVNLGGAGDITKTHIRWSYTKTVPQVPSVIEYQGVLYLANDGGILVSIDPETGEMLKRERLSGSGRKYDASPVAADGRIFLLDVDGNLAVVTAGRPWELAATSSLGEACHATPAIADGRLYVRTETTLYCFAADAGKTD